MEYTIKNIVEQIHLKGIRTNPLTDKDIDSIIQKSPQNHLPEIYIQFLKVMGGGTPNGFLNGNSCFINELPFLRSWAEELLSENDFKKQLTNNDFVFWMSQGYQFAFFKLDEGDNPPIYYYREGTNQIDFIKISKTFSEFLHRIEINDRHLFDI